MKPGPERVDLNEREGLCLQMKSDGYNNYEIAEKLGLSEHAIASCFESICQKLGTKNTFHSIAEGIRSARIT